MRLIRWDYWHFTGMETGEALDGQMEAGIAKTIIYLARAILIISPQLMLRMPATSSMTVV